MLWHGGQGYSASDLPPPPPSLTLVSEPQLRQVASLCTFLTSVYLHLLFLLFGMSFSSSFAWLNSTHPLSLYLSAVSSASPSCLLLKVSIYFYFLSFLKFRVQLLYNVLLVSALQQHAWAISIPISLSSWKDTWIPSSRQPYPTPLGCQKAPGYTARQLSIYFSTPPCWLRPQLCHLSHCCHYLFIWHLPKCALSPWLSRVHGT